MTSNATRRAQAAAKRSTVVTPAPSSAPSDMWKLRAPDGSINAGWYLVPLRLFLGATFLFAGLQKLANPDFFRSSSAISIHAQLVGTSHTSPIGGILKHFTGASTLLGAVIAIAEVAIGVGALLGLLTRVAAIGGVLVSFSLFLAISYHTHPYYTGSDIVFLFAWTPLALAGASGAPALDTWLDARGAPSTAPDASTAETMTRGAFIGSVTAVTAVLIGVVTGTGRVLAPASSNASSTLGGVTTAPTTTGAAGTGSTTTAPATQGTAIGAASQVPVGGSASFTDPKSGDPSLVIQHTADNFVAFDAICPHAGCTVAYQSSADVIACPCHGSAFNPRTGAVLNGPATSGLNPIRVIKGSNGDLYVV